MRYLGAWRNILFQLEQPGEICLSYHTKLWQEVELGTGKVKQIFQLLNRRETYRNLSEPKVACIIIITQTLNTMYAS